MGLCLWPGLAGMIASLGSPATPAPAGAAAGGRPHGQAASRARSTPATGLAHRPSCDAPGQQSR